MKNRFNIGRQRYVTLILIQCLSNLWRTPFESSCLLGFSFKIRVLTLTAWYPFDSHPPDREHAGVMVDVQKRNLVVLLTQQEEYRVQKLDQLGEVVPPQGFGDLENIIRLNASNDTQFIYNKAL